MCRLLILAALVVLVWILANPIVGFSAALHSQAEGYVVVHLPDGTVANARLVQDGSVVVIDGEAPGATLAKRGAVAVAAEESPSPNLSESTYRELMAVPAMENTGRSRRGSL